MSANKTEGKASRKWLTLQEAANQYGAHPITVRRWIAAGEIAGYKVGKRAIRVDQVELDAYASQIPTV